MTRGVRPGRGNEGETGEQPLLAFGNAGWMASKISIAGNGALPTIRGFCRADPGRYDLFKPNIAPRVLDVS
jgi:hypothetical protein